MFFVPGTRIRRLVLSSNVQHPSETGCCILADLDLSVAAPVISPKSVRSAFEVPSDVHLYVNAFHTEGDASVGKHGKETVGIRNQRVRKVGFTGGAPEFILRDQGWVVGSGNDLYIVPGDGFSREALPEHQVNEMGRHVGDPFTLAADVVVPGGTDQRLAGNFLVEVMDAFHDDGRIPGRSRKDTAQVGKTFPDADVQRVIPFGHQFEDDQPFFLCGPIGFLQAGVVFRGQCHRFVRQYMISFLDGLKDVFGLSRIVSRKDDRIPFPGGR